MTNITTDLLDLLTLLLPGFIAAWVIYGLTSYPKPAQFERVVEALIFSFLIRAVLPLEEQFLIFVGLHFTLGVWDYDAELLAAGTTGLVFGLIGSYCANNDKAFAVARRFQLTKRTIYPSEWYGAFSTKPRYVVLHVSGGRRISGWPLQWPSDPTSGHFELNNAAWLAAEPSEKEISLPQDYSILIAAKDVEMVEFLKDIDETNDAAKAD